MQSPTLGAPSAPAIAVRRGPTLVVLGTLFALASGFLIFRALG
tara:strand:- start:1903 stop:2031 length:129 start_codon:yes stop_codon:yes gene_type:complete